MEKVTLSQVRILQIEIEHFKNIEYGALTFPSFKIARRHGFGKGRDVVGIYGQNGSGKTALVEALIVWQLLQQNLSIPIEYGVLIKKDASIQLLFQLVENGCVYQVKQGYIFPEKEGMVHKEITSYRIFEEGKWSRPRKKLPPLLRKRLEEYAVNGLWIATPRQLGLINLNLGSTTDFALHETQGISLFEENILECDKMPAVNRIVEQLNIILQAFLPGLQIGLEEQEEEKQCRFHLIAKRYDTEFPLQNESGGIKRLLSIMTVLIAGFHNPSLCVVIDEVDAGVFEYLLGELLEMMRSSARGQFLFTSHNLRALEVLGADHIVFSTANPQNRYIQFSKLRKHHNLRDEYLRAVLLGGQEESMYEEPQGYLLGYAFRKAGKLYDET